MLRQICSCGILECTRSENIRADVFQNTDSNKNSYFETGTLCRNHVTITLEPKQTLDTWRHRWQDMHEKNVKRMPKYKEYMPDNRLDEIIAYMNVWRINI